MKSQQLLAHLRARGFAVNADNAPSQLNDMEWYLQFVIAFGTFLAAICLGFLWDLLHLYRLEKWLLSCGALFFIAAAIFIYRRIVIVAARQSCIKIIFAIQISFLLIISSKFLLLIIVADVVDEARIVIAATAAALSAATFAFYTIKTEQIISLGVTLFLLQIIGFWENVTLALSLFLMFYFACSLRVRRWRYCYLSFLLAVFMRLNYQEIFANNDDKLLTSFAVALPLALFCVYLARQRRDYRLILLLILIGALAFFLSPMIFFSLLLMTLAHAQREKWLLIIATILLPCYLTIYYYQLEINLLNKSYLLIASGALLLLAAATIFKMGWHRYGEKI